MSSRKKNHSVVKEEKKIRIEKKEGKERKRGRLKDGKGEEGDEG